MVASVKQYAQVPKDLVENVRFRQEVIRGSRDPRTATALYRMCADDLLFWVNTFAFTFDPRKTACPRLPFVTYEYQDEAFLAVDAAIDGDMDLLIEKSRDMGASWIILTVFGYRWIFRPLQAFLMLSRIEDNVDKKDEPDCLFWKLDFLISNLPAWMRPATSRMRLSLKNEDNGSTITGAATTGESGRGGRKTAILLDEFASVPDGHAMLRSTRDVTNCRLYNSTPKGVGNAFADLVRKNEVPKLRFHWTQHPEKSAGLYHDDLGKPRSPWYDKQCARAVHPMEIAQELDIDYLGSDYQFFEPTMIDKLMRCDAREPMFTGELEYDAMALEPQGTAPVGGGKGRLRLWTALAGGMRAPGGRRYTVGVDVAQGTGASNSCISIFDRVSRQKVGAWVHSKTRPDVLADIAVVLCRMFNNAYLAWEANGPGRSFGDRVLEIGYSEIYYRRNEEDVSKRMTRFPGWWSGEKTKQSLFGLYRRALTTGQFINRDADAINECREIVYTSAGTIAHAREGVSVDPSGAKDNHGDRPTADALACLAAGGVETVEVDEVDSECQRGTFAWRRQMARKSQRETSLW